MTEPTIPELVARLREAWLQIDNHELPERVRFKAIDDVQTIVFNNLPTLLDALERQTSGDSGGGPPEPPGSTLAPSSPWRPIEECGELEEGEIYPRPASGPGPTASGKTKRGTSSSRRCPSV